MDFQLDDAVFQFVHFTHLQHHSGNPAGNHQRDIVVDKGWDDGVADVVVLSVGVQTHGRAERRVGRGRTGVAQCARRTDDGDGCQRREAEADTQRHINCGNDRQSRERRADAHGDQQSDKQHGKCRHAFIAAKKLHTMFDQRFDFACRGHDCRKTLRRNHDETDHRHHFDAFAEHITGGIAVHHTEHHEDGKTQHRAQHQRIFIHQLNRKTHTDRDCRHQTAVSRRLGLFGCFAVVFRIDGIGLINA